MGDNKNDMNGLGPVDKVVDMGDLYGNPIQEEKETDTTPDVDLDDIELSEEEEALLKEKLKRIRESDPFIYR